MIKRYNRLVEDSINLYYHGKSILEKIMEEETDSSNFMQERLKELDIENFYLANGYKIV
jgi:hypothetical protein